MRKEMQYRHLATNLETREEESGELFLEGYFAVFNQRTQLWGYAFEEIAPEAFANTFGNDIRALINHDTMFVLGRNKASTLELKVDSHGLWGRVKINQKDSDAMNLYERVKRGDVSGNSFGFNIVSEETTWNDDGTVIWRLTEIDLHEVSVVTFPAYEQTVIQARMEEVEQHKNRVLEVRKCELKRRIANVKATNDSKKD